MNSPKAFPGTLTPENKTLPADAPGIGTALQDCNIAVSKSLHNLGSLKILTTAGIVKHAKCL